MPTAGLRDDFGAEGRVRERLAFDGKRETHVLGTCEGATENAEVCKSLLTNLVDRGLPTNRALLAVIDGSRALAKALRDVFGKRVLIHMWRGQLRSGSPRVARRERESTTRPTFFWTIRSPTHYPTELGVMSMTSWVSGVCRANGINIHYLRTGGAKPPLVLLHGLTGSGACWTPLARALEGEYDVVMPDARGHGSSSTPLHGYRYEDHASDVIELIRALGLSAPILVGHSMGGMTAALVTSLAVKSIRGVVLVDPTFLSPQRQREVHESDVAEQHRRLLSQDKSDVVAQLRLRHARRSPEIVEWIASARLQTRMNAFDVLTPPNPEYQQVVRAIDVPLLLVIGDAGVVSLETARDLQRMNSRVQIELIPGAGHGVLYDQPERVQAAVQPFLRGFR